MLTHIHHTLFWVALIWFRLAFAPLFLRLFRILRHNGIDDHSPQAIQNKNCVNRSDPSDGVYFFHALGGENREIHNLNILFIDLLSLCFAQFFIIGHIIEFHQVQFQLRCSKLFLLILIVLIFSFFELLQEFLPVSANIKGMLVDRVSHNVIVDMNLELVHANFEEVHPGPKFKHRAQKGILRILFSEFVKNQIFPFVFDFGTVFEQTNNLIGIILDFHSRESEHLESPRMDGITVLTEQGFTLFGVDGVDFTVPSFRVHFRVDNFLVGIHSREGVFAVKDVLEAPDVGQTFGQSGLLGKVDHHVEALIHVPLEVPGFG